MYDRFSEIYDRLVFDIDYDAYAARILREFALRGVPRGRLLELGCGTGNLTLRLKEQFREIIAVDRSDAMLSVAWNKSGGAENIRWLCQDIRALDVPICDAAVSLLDTMNYLLSEEELRAAFQRVHDSLSPGGVFCFDLNTSRRLIEEIGENTWIYETEGIFYTWESEVSGDIVDFQLTFFVKGEDGRYERIDETQTQRCHRMEDVCRLLGEIGFRDVRVVDLDTGEAASPESRRLLFSMVRA